jgi:hypothetical protein
MLDIINQFTPEVTIIASIFAFAWLLIGVAIGMHLRRYRSGGTGNAISVGERGGDRRGGGKVSSKGGGKGGEIVEVYIGNLAYEVSEKDLSKAFGEFGEVVSTRVIKNRFSGKSKGFGFVELDGRDQANAAIRSLNGKDFKGRRIVANEARSRSR